MYFFSSKQDRSGIETVKPVCAILAILANLSVHFLCYLFIWLFIYVFLYISFFFLFFYVTVFIGKYIPTYLLNIITPSTLNFINNKSVTLFKYIYLLFPGRGTKCGKLKLNSVIIRFFTLYSRTTLYSAVIKNNKHYKKYGYAARAVITMGRFMIM